MFGNFGKYLGEVRAELHKATWPWEPKERGIKKYRQLIDSTVVVLVASLLLGAYVAFCDIVMVYVLKALTWLGTLGR
ncbi:MAG: preprotein translocase subunit SecE [Verrucomicrobiales bacterium]|nr:preprotein translocase subunit SecE [Verrucomicrobiae bacterium]HRX55917.1 preprotein translocase subunit SecE [Verrucomicrobiales bacterium]